MLEIIDRFFSTISDFTGLPKELSGTILGLLFALIPFLFSLFRFFWSASPKVDPEQEKSEKILYPSDLAVQLKALLMDNSKDWDLVSCPNTTYIYLGIKGAFYFAGYHDRKAVSQVQFQGKDLPGLSEDDLKYLFPYFMARYTSSHYTQQVAKQNRDWDEKFKLNQEIQAALAPPAPEPTVQVVTKVYVPTELTIKLAKKLSDPEAGWSYMGTYRDTGPNGERYPAIVIKLESCVINAALVGGNYRIIKVLQGGKNLFSRFTHEDLDYLDKALSGCIERLFKKQNQKEDEEIQQSESALISHLDQAPATSPEPEANSNHGVYKHFLFSGQEYCLYTGTPSYSNPKGFTGEVDGKEVPLMSLVNCLYYKKDS